MVWIFLEKNIFWVSIGVFVLFLGVFYGSAYLIRDGDIKKIKTEFPRKKIMFAYAKEYLGDLKRLSSRYDDFPKEVLSKLNTILPESKEIPDLVVGLEAMALENGLVLKEIKEIPNDEIETEIKNNNLAAIDVSVTVEGGDYLKIKHFLAAIEQSMRIADVQSFSFSPVEKEHKFVLRVYHFK